MSNERAPLHHGIMVPCPACRENNFYRDMNVSEHYGPLRDNDEEPLDVVGPPAHLLLVCRHCHHQYNRPATPTIAFNFTCPGCRRTTVQMIEPDVEPAILEPDPEDEFPEPVAVRSYPLGGSHLECHHCHAVMKFGMICGESDPNLIGHCEVVTLNTATEEGQP